MINRAKNLAIYQPNGAASEYSRWACNLYNGCTHRCAYCYCRRGVFTRTLGLDMPEVKKQLGGTSRSAYDIFCKELAAYREQIIADGGLFFSFSTDPMLREEINLTMQCVHHSVMVGVPVFLLTKATWWMDDVKAMELLYAHRDLITVGFTLTGHDELEPGADGNIKRINAIRSLHTCHIRTFSSIEPVIDFTASLLMIMQIADCCPEVRIGLMSPYSPRKYNWQQCDNFIFEVIKLSQKHGFKVLWKESIRRFHENERPTTTLSDKR